ncbi:MAG: hypothetical protein JXR78_05845 [Victivallales bacterium]|nr:hypothetical protein [Victivallales bacterium]
MTLASTLRKAGLKVVSEVENKSMKAQMRSANRIEAAAVVIRGENELENNIVIVKDMRDGSQQELGPDALAEFLREQYG